MLLLANQKGEVKKLFDLERVYMGGSLSNLYHLYKPCVVRITVRNSNGDLVSGTGSHIGDGYILTARHVIEGNEIEEIAPHRYTAKNISIKQRFYPSDSRIDLAVFHTDFSLTHYMKSVTILRGPGKTPEPKIDYIPFGGHLDDWLGDELLMTKVLIMGFPTIPFSDRPELVAIEGEVNAIIDKYSGPHPHFILSTVPRGGFSGGPVISEYNCLLGVVTESLITDNKELELGFTSAISIQPILDLLDEHKIYPGDNGKFIRRLFYDEE